MSELWYELADATVPLSQGDVIVNCPVIGWKAEPLSTNGADHVDVLRGAALAEQADVVVMTQACDLAQNKVRNAILCPHLSLNAYKTEWEASQRAKSQNPTPKAWKTVCSDICDGFVWNLAMLNAEQSDGVTAEHRIVDFHEVYTAPRAFLESLLVQRKEPRLRLRPPYREHLSQAFARYFMRVGLPVNIQPVW